MNHQKEMHGCNPGTSVIFQYREFPKPISLGAWVVGWLEENIQNLIEGKRKESNGDA